MVEQNCSNLLRMQCGNARHRCTAQQVPRVSVSDSTIEAAQLQCRSAFRFERQGRAAHVVKHPVCRCLSRWYKKRWWRPGRTLPNMQSRERRETQRDAESA